MGTALLLYPDQLFEVEYLPKVKRIYLVEEPLYFGTDRESPFHVHKQKLVLHRASMMRYAEEVLWPNGFEVEYIQNGPDNVTDTALVKAAFDGASEISVFDPVNHELWDRLQKAADALEVHVPLKKLPNPNFYLSESDILKFFNGKSSVSFAEFYQWQRERFNVLIDDDYRPFGGKLMYDQAKIKHLPKTLIAPGFQTFGDNKFVQEAIVHIESMYPNNPGTMTEFIWPTNHQESQQWLNNFFKDRLSSFAEYEQNFEASVVLLFHSAISPMLNSGLLNPRQVIESLLEYSAKSKVEIPLESLENFIRQVIGWREYARAVYVTKRRSDYRLQENPNARRLTSLWWESTTGVKPIDDLIAKATKYGYLHNPERTLVELSMLMADVDIDEIYSWFRSMFVDAYEWILEPSVYGLAEIGGELTKDKLPHYPSTALIEMSDYSKDSWCDSWDGLYWRYVDLHRSIVSKKYRGGSQLVSRYDGMDEARKRIIGYRAQDFLDSTTVAL